MTMASCVLKSLPFPYEPVLIHLPQQVSEINNQSMASSE